MQELDPTLRDGRVVHLRAMQARDEEELLQAFARMSSEARYMRLMHVVREPDRERLRALLASFPQAGIGIVATVPAADGLDVVGSAMAIYAAGGASCEFATSVSAAYGGAGLGTLLLRVLIDEARQRGCKEMEGYVLSENKAMLALARKLGFSVAYVPGDASVRICRLAL
ncbi:GNAT family N-acetyltransferase [Ramlibacter sp. XY19]|uniref:GNAT family N-acetyltransferase n=1 Tax=Ramlibacter paludis TaxID=2908000 RepID=UPI0023DA25D0|nr:GNAT family N-acetyltransferase [Ramlibacter paludis]MCG2594296.1 GNAT family N-acetyltransferase [Ramlibacter paludis]